MKLFICTFIALIAGISVQAQERIAAGATDAKMTWSALSSKANSIDGKVGEVGGRVDRIVLCGKKNMIYAPEATGADAEGCVYASLTPSTTTIINNMSACARNGAVYSDTTKACIQPDKPRWYYVSAISNLSGIPACAGSKGSVARLCATAGERCYKSTTTSYTTEQQCKQTGDTGGWEGCWGGGTVTTTSYHLYACE